MGENKETMTELLTIAQLGDPILRQPAQGIEEINDPQLQALIDNLLATMQASNGVGIAAPQVSQPLQLVIVASRPTLRYPHALMMEPIAMLNPRLLSHGDEIVKDWEGCLSIPGLRAQVPRYRVIEIEYCDRQGNLHHQKLTDFVARIFQHEYDHLQGQVYLDRVESSYEMVTEQEYFKLIQPVDASKT